MLKSWYTESCSSLTIRQTISAGPEWFRSKISARDQLGDNELISIIQLSTKTCLKFCCGRVFVPPEGNSDCCFCHLWRTAQREPGGQKASTPLPISKSHQHKLTQQPLEQRMTRLHIQRTLMRLLPSTVATSTLGTLRTSTMALTRPISQSCG